MECLHEAIKNKGYIIYRQETILDKKEFHKILKDLEAKTRAGDIESFAVLPGAGFGEKNERAFFAEKTYTFYVKRV